MKDDYYDYIGKILKQSKNVRTRFINKISIYSVNNHIKQMVFEYNFTEHLNFLI